MTVDLDQNKAWGHARWKDAQGRDQEFKSPVFDWDSAAGNVACLSVDIDKRKRARGHRRRRSSGRGQRAAKSIRIRSRTANTRSSNSTAIKKPIELPAEIQWISKPWNGDQRPDARTWSTCRRRIGC